MEQEGPSFWTDIKKYEDTLERDPNSYCFAPLSELYRKLGMVDDAITIAKRGCEIHPEYVGGYMALGRAYFEKGMNAEAKEALGKVVRVTPDNILAQRILSKIYMDEGDASSAEGSLRAILAHNPDESESRMLLESLVRTSASVAQQTFVQGEDATEFGSEERMNPDDGLSQWEEIEDCIDLEGCEIVEEITDEQSPGPEEGEDAWFESDSPVKVDEMAGEFCAVSEEDEKDPLTTVTLAELYVSQGYPKRALKIFRELLEAEPENIQLAQRIHSLKQEIDEDEGTARAHPQDEFPGMESVEPVPDQTGAFPASEYAREIPGLGKVAEPDFAGFDAEGEDVPTPEETAVSEEIALPEIPTLTETENVLSAAEDLRCEVSQPSLSDEKVIRTLEIWLENIKRRR